MRKDSGSPLPSWLSFALAALTLVCGGMAAAYGTFETKDYAKERSSQIETRLDRIERKIDALLDSRR